VVNFLVSENEWFDEKINIQKIINIFFTKLTLF